MFFKNSSYPAAHLRIEVRFLVALYASLFFICASPSTLAQRVEKEKEEETRRFYPDDPLWQDADTMDTPEVRVFQLEREYDFLENTFLQPKLPYGTTSLNINTLGEVPDSSWFTNRIGVRDMTVEEVVRGPDTVDGPAPGVWKITGRPTGGITPKFTIRDERGDTYLFKLDPPHMPELPSTAEMISTKIFHALGYNVPEDFLVNLDPSVLEIEPGEMWRDDKGKRREILPEDVDHWLREYIQRSPDGKIRVLASKFIRGIPVGQYKHYGTRPDDPNDIYPHERRRGLRAMRVFAAWLNHDDSRSPNTFDSYVEEGGRRFIRHYLLDFGSNLGSGSTKFQEPRAGYEYYIEGDKVVKGIVALRMWQRPWMKVKYREFPSVGRYEADFFEPWNWKPEYPNPAFDRMDDADAFWGARLVSRFTDELIHAIVGTAEMSDPEAESYLTNAIIRRRDKVVRYWITRINPLDEFEVSGLVDTGLHLTFNNAAIRIGAAPQGATYRVRWSALDNLAGQERPVGDEVDLREARATVPKAAWGPPDDAGYRYAVAAIHTLDPDFPHWKPVLVTLRDRVGQVDVVGIERLREK